MNPPQSTRGYKSDTTLLQFLGILPCTNLVSLVPKDKPGDIHSVGSLKRLVTTNSIELQLELNIKNVRTCITKLVPSFKIAGPQNCSHKNPLWLTLVQRGLGILLLNFLSGLCIRFRDSKSGGRGTKLLPGSNGLLRVLASDESSVALNANEETERAGSDDASTHEHEGTVVRKLTEPKSEGNSTWRETCQLTLGPISLVDLGTYQCFHRLQQYRRWNQSQVG